MVESEEPANTVVQVFQKGYLLADRVLRPAMVAVAKPRAGASFVDAADGRGASLIQRSIPPFAA